MIKSIFSHLYQKLKAFFLSRKFAYIASGTIAAFLLFNYGLMPWYVGHGGTLTVPDVANMQFEEAQAKLSDLGLVAVESDKILDNEHPIGSIITQNPKPGAVVKYGRRVYLTVCGGEVLTPVPLIRGRSLRDANFALERNGLVLGKIDSANSDSNPVNTIISQAIAPTERVKKGTAIDVTLSLGSSRSTITVPSLYGKSLSEAGKMLEYLSLKVGLVTYQVHIELLPNTVVDQFPVAGTEVDSGKTIDLFVVKAGQVQDEH